MNETAPQQARSEVTYQKGDLVVIGPKGKVTHKVEAVIATGRVTRYDIRSITGKQGVWHIGILEHRLHPAPKTKPESEVM